VKTSQRLATCLAIGLISALTVPEVRAQQPQQPQQRAVGPVAILDLTYIFKNHARFQAMTEAMRGEVEAAEKQLGVERDAMQNLAKSIEQYKRGTPEYKQIEEELIKRQNDLQLKVNLQKKTFLETEAKIYYTIYQEVNDRVRYFADTNGISLVLRFNGDPIDRNDPQEVLKELNKSVIYYNRAIDITPIILEQLGPGPARPNTVGGPGAPVNPAFQPQQPVPGQAGGVPNTVNRTQFGLPPR
jgi:Skp family chaperone for outer membrane proteins